MCYDVPVEGTAACTIGDMIGGIHANAHLVQVTVSDRTGRTDPGGVRVGSFTITLTYVPCSYRPCASIDADDGKGEGGNEGQHTMSHGCHRLVVICEIGGRKRVNIR